MKKILVLFLALTLIFAFAACGSAGNENTETNEAYSFAFDGKALVPGAKFDPKEYKDASSIYQVPSCAIEGTDNVYNYGSFEVTAFDDGKNEVIYSIYIIDANTSTDEGIYLGDDANTVTEIYGDKFTENDTERTYIKGKTAIVFIIENDFVASIEYRMITE